MTLLAIFWENPAVVGLIIAGPAAILGFLGYRRSRGIDEVAKQAGLATDRSTSIGQVVDGLNTIIARLQEDNKVLRDDIASLREGVELCQARIDVVELGNANLLAKNLVLERENVALHAEIEELRAENQVLTARIAQLEKVNGPS